MTIDSMLEDETLLEKIQQGSHLAFSTLLKRHLPRFYRLAYRYVSHKETAEDVVQRAFLKLWEKPNSWDQKKQVRFTTWFSRVVINLSLDIQKKRTPLLLAEPAEPEDSHPIPEEILISAQQKVQLEHAIRSLPERQQTALNLCFYEEVKQADAAEIMEINIKALESLLMRAKANLRMHLEGYERKKEKHDTGSI